MMTKLKSLALPILEHRWLLERAKYVGTKILSPQEGNDCIAAALADSRAIAVGKMGSVESGALGHYLRHKNTDEFCDRWGRHAKLLSMNAGLFPSSPEVFSRFCKLYSQTLTDLDLIGVWFQPGEHRLGRLFAPAATPIALTALEPFFHERPWSANLEGKRVLVVTPFANAVEAQYIRRADVWRGYPDVLPNFHLETLRCPLSAGLVDSGFPDWFAALDAMSREMDRRVFDVAIIGAGAWGIPLVSHAKNGGRTAIHLGGPTQLLFGIRGGRWDNHPIIRTFTNDAWVRPSGDDRPIAFKHLENGCYW